MKKAITTIEEELNWLIKDYKATTDHSSGKHIHTLNYQIHIDKKKVKLIFQFLFMPKEAGLSMKLIYQVRDKERNIHEFEYPFSKIKSGLDLPMINDYDRQRIFDIMDYDIIDGEMKSVVSPLTQSVTYTEVIRRNIDAIIDYGQKINVNSTD